MSTSSLGGTCGVDGSAGTSAVPEELPVLPIEAIQFSPPTSLAAYP